MRVRSILISAVLGVAGMAAIAGPASAAPTKIGTESFSLTSDINAEGGPVVASGVINDTGTDVVISDTEDLFDFGANGTVTVFHSPRHSVNHFSEKKCTFSFTEKGTYVFGNGTGEWEGFTGSGRYTVRGSATDACGTSPVGTVTIDASGPISPIPTD